MPERVCLFHWNEREAEERAGQLRSAGYDVVAESRFDPVLLRALAESPPDAFVVDLTRLPAQGRDAALALRSRLGTRRVPLVIVGGDPEAVERLRALLPDATYGSWPELSTLLPRALADPPVNPVVPISVLAGYSGTPLPKKLGIKPHSVVAVIDAPDGFTELLGPLPEGATLCPHARGRFDLAVWFVRSVRQLRPARFATLARKGPIWVAWPKKSSGLQTGLSETFVRETGLSQGLVDYKICAIDETWSGLLFRRRR